MSIAYYLQVGLTTLILAGVLYGLLRVSRTYQTQKFSGEIQILDRKALENQVSLMIVKVRDKEMLLSVTSKRVRLLHHF